MEMTRVAGNWLEGGLDSEREGMSKRAVMDQGGNGDSFGGRIGGHDLGRGGEAGQAGWGLNAGALQTGWFR